MATLINSDIATIVGRFFQRSDIISNMGFLAQRLPLSAVILVAGGAIRNLIIDRLYGRAPATSDIDIFICGLGGDFHLTSILKDQKVIPTDLKGIRWMPDKSPLAYDVSLLPNFIVIATCNLDPTPTNLLACIDFTVNTAIYNYGRHTLTEKGCITAIQNRIIDFNCRIIPDKFLIAYRILLLTHKTGFKLSPSVFHFITKCLKLETVSRLYRLFRVKKGKIDSLAIMNGYDRLCKYASYEAYLEDWSPDLPNDWVCNRGQDL